MTHAHGPGEEQAHRLLDTAQHAIALVGVDGRLLLYNDALGALLGYGREELPGLRLATVLPPADMSRLEGVARGEGPRRFHAALRRKDGQRVEAEIACSAFADHDRVVGIFVELHDVSAEERLRERLTLVQKTEALGTLVAGVAHDFNNLLTIISGNLDLAATRSGADRWYHDAQQATTQAIALVAQLLQFSRRATPARTAVDLGALVRDTAALAEATFDRRIALALDLPAEPAIVVADRGQIQQVVMNLLLNARDAVAERMQAHGTPAGTASAPYAPAIRIAVSAQDAHARLAVEDNGAGMSPDVRERVFEPFFTTKAAGQGTGLGLSTAHAIITAHSGALTVRSEPQRGAHFEVALPLDTAVAPEHAVAIDGGSSPTCHCASVLVVDDEPQIGSYVAQVLAHAGCHVSVRRNGEDALRAVAEQAFDVVLLDVNMPTPNGWETLAHLRQVRPDQRVVIMSGYATAAEAAERGAYGTLQKPFHSDALLRAVSDAVAGSPADGPADG